MHHIKQLDSLRAFAVFLVLMWHGLPGYFPMNFLPNGQIGVSLFFVLSGFLITKILLENKVKVEEGKRRNAAVLKTFYMRRVLRIFPVYYLSILCIYLLHRMIGTDLTPSEFYHSLSYTMNVFVYSAKTWPQMTFHFWSLAVEEQFYLVWPFAMLLVRKRYLLSVILAFILIGMVSQALIVDREYGYTPTYTCFDALGMGALLAWMVVYKPEAISRFRKGAVVLALLCAAIAGIGVTNSNFFYPQRTIFSVIALALIAFIVETHERAGWWNTYIFNNRVFRFLGRLSYGIYLYHVPVYVVCNLFLFPVIDKLNHQYAYYIFFGVNVGLVVLVAWLSWNVIEAPVLKCKKYFSYQEGPGTKTKALVVVQPVKTNRVG